MAQDIADRLNRADEYITIPKMRMGMVPKDEAKGQL